MSIHRIKIKIPWYHSVDNNDFVHFDVSPHQNPFEVADKIAHEVMDGFVAPTWKLFALSSKPGIPILNWNAINNGDEVLLEVYDFFEAIK